MNCKKANCKLLVSFRRRPGIGVWKATNAHAHSQEFAEELNGKIFSGYCASVYTDKQVLRCVLPYVAEKGDLETSDIKALVKSKWIFRKIPLSRFFCSIRQSLITHMAKSRDLQIAAM